jgi:hypothetical protein
MERPLSKNDIQTIADYLLGSSSDLEIALSELGFDPELYSKREMRCWLYEETTLYQHNGTWIAEE